MVEETTTITTMASVPAAPKTSKYVKEYQVLIFTMI
jgi:hypothetical protein